MILSYLFYAFLAFLLYRLVFGFIIPIVRTTRRVKRSFRQMQEQMNAQYGQQPAGAYSGGYDQPSQNLKKDKNEDEDYIEFEEVK